MRRRSGALDAETCEEYVSKYYQKVLTGERPRSKTDCFIGSTSKTSSPKDKAATLGHSPKGQITSFGDYKIKPYIYKNRVDSPDSTKRTIAFDGFDFNNESAKEKLSRFSKFGSSSNSSSAQNGSENPEGEDDTSMGSEASFQSTAEEPHVEEVPKTIENRRIMIIGQKDVGRHSFVNNLFPDCPEEKYENRGPMDLMIKRVETDYSIVNYHFWMKRADDNNFQSVVDIYYKFIDLFIFMFSLTDKTSFDTLDASIELAKLRSNKFRAILLGFKNDSADQSVVLTEEAEALKNKFKLETYIESAGDSDSNLYENFVSLFNNSQL